jgi:hypothetical protein
LKKPTHVSQMSQVCVVNLHGIYTAMML